MNNMRKIDVYISVLLAGKKDKWRRIMVCRCEEETLDAARAKFMEEVMLQCEKDHAQVVDMQIIRSEEDPLVILKLLNKVASLENELEQSKPKTGRWVPSGMFDDMAKCSVCGSMECSLHEAYSRPHNYCLNCGAKMNLEDISDA